MDRLSNLPDALLHHILSFMPMQDVVRTSLLSKRWKDCWISVPNLLFEICSSPDDYYDRFVNFANRTLIFRGCSKIKSFKIQFYADCSYQETDLDLWMRYALENDVEELLLEMFPLQSSYFLPQFLYICSSVKTLTLQGCSMSFSKQINWTSLKSLILCYMDLPEEVTQKVLLGSPNLEYLEVISCYEFNGLSTNSTSLKKLNITDTDALGTQPVYLGGALRISAPNVKSLHLSGNLYRRCFLIDVSSLVHATLDFSLDIYNEKEFDDYQNRLLEVFGSLDHVENLTLGIWCIKFIAVKEKKGLASPPSSKRKSLTLISPIKQEEDLLGILHLLKCSPSLETLTLDMETHHHRYLYELKLDRFVGFYNFGEENYLTSQVNIINCMLHHLKVVNIVKFVDQSPVFLLIEFLLKKSEVLERIVIRAKKRRTVASSESLFHAALKLLAMPRLSPGAVVTLLE